MVTFRPQLKGMQELFYVRERVAHTLDQCTVSGVSISFGGGQFSGYSARPTSKQCDQISPGSRQGVCALPASENSRYFTAKISN